MKRVLFYITPFIVISCMMSQCQCQTYPNSPRYYVVLDIDDNPAIKYIRFTLYYNNGNDSIRSRVHSYEDMIPYPVLVNKTSKMAFYLYNKDTLFMRDTTITLDSLKVDTCSITVLVKVNADTTFTVSRYPITETAEPRKTIL